MLAFLQVKKRLNGFCNCETSQQCWKLQIDISPFQFNWNVATIKTSSLTQSDSQDGGVVLWTSKHLLKNEALVHAVNIFKATCLIFLGLASPSAATLSDLSSIWIASGRLSSSWENGLSCVSLLYVIWHNQQGWNYSMSIHEFFCIYQRQKNSLNARDLLMHQLSVILRLAE